MSDIVINDITYSGIDTIMVNKTNGEKAKYTEGERPSGTINININGTYNVTNYESANVNVPTPDLSTTTATADDVLEGKEFYNASGEKVTGTYKDMLQARVDETNSCEYLFYKYTGTNFDFLRNLDMSNVHSINYMFNYVTSPIYVQQTFDLSFLNVSNVETMNSLFSYCSYLTVLDLSNWDITNAKEVQAIFSNCKELTTINGLNTWITGGERKHIASMFKDCRKMTEINLSNWVLKVHLYAYSLFQNCTSLLTINLGKIDFSSATAFYDMFNGCNKLTDIIGEIDLSSAVNVSNMFNSCQKLTNVTLKNIKKSIQIGSGTSYGTLLTDNTIVNTFQELHDLTGSTAQTLTLSTPSNARTEAIYVKLIDVTDEMRAEDQYIDSKKPCVVCESTDEGAMTLKEYGISKNWNIA